MNTDLLLKVDKEYMQELDISSDNTSNMYKNNLLISFSGIAGSGKSTLAMKIAKEFNGILINKDDIRNIISSVEKDLDGEQTHQLAQEYIFKLLNNLKSKGYKLFIIDAGVDRQYVEYKEWCKENEFELFVIQIIIDKATAIERLRIREKDNFDHYKKNIDIWIKDQKKFQRNGLASYVLESHSDRTDLIQTIREKLI